MSADLEAVFYLVSLILAVLAAAGVASRVGLFPAAFAFFVTVFFVNAAKLAGWF